MNGSLLKASRRYGLAAALLLAMSPIAMAQIAPAAPTVAAPTSVTVPSTGAGRTLVAGKDYLVLAKPMPAPKDRLEVAYFFWYNSPTSAKLDPLIRGWAQNKASSLVKFRPLPAVLDNSWSYGARVFFALDEMDKERQISPRLMQAMSQGIVDYNSPKSMTAWMTDQGISKKDMNQAINRPTVIAKTSWIPSLMKRYGVEKSPTVVIDGQFVFSPRPQERVEDFMSRVAFASEALTKRKLVMMAQERALKKGKN